MGFKSARGRRSRRRQFGGDRRPLNIIENAPATANTAGFFLSRFLRIPRVWLQARTRERIGEQSERSARGSRRVGVDISLIVSRGLRKGRRRSACTGESAGYLRGGRNGQRPRRVGDTDQQRRRRAGADVEWQ